MIYAERRRAGRAGIGSGAASWESVSKFPLRKEESPGFSRGEDVKSA